MTWKSLLISSQDLKQDCIITSRRTQSISVRITLSGITHLSNVLHVLEELPLAEVLEEPWVHFNALWTKKLSMPRLLNLSYFSLYFFPKLGLINVPTPILDKSMSFSQIEEISCACLEFRFCNPF